MEFFKFDGAGNDFVVIDNRNNAFHPSHDEIAHLCHRRFGVGADGLMTLDAADEGYDFVMHYYNSDGRLGSMCGNGGRCIAMFAHLLGLSREVPGHSPFRELDFIGYDGPHHAVIVEWDERRRCGTVRLGMHDVDEVRRVEGGWYLDTGSPHFVLPVNGLKDYDVEGRGRAWRHRTDLFPEGANIDFVEERADGTLHIRTYERGVEDETWACGTGVTAAALVTGHHHVSARGGDFTVEFESFGNSYEYVTLTGPVSLNFIGQWISFQA